MINRVITLKTHCNTSQTKYKHTLRGLKRMTATKY